MAFIMGFGLVAGLGAMSDGLINTAGLVMDYTCSNGLKKKHHKCSSLHTCSLKGSVPHWQNMMDVSKINKAHRNLK